MRHTVAVAVRGMVQTLDQMRLFMVEMAAPMAEVAVLQMFIKRQEPVASTEAREAVMIATLLSLAWTARTLVVWDSNSRATARQARPTEAAVGATEDAAETV